MSKKESRVREYVRALIVSLVGAPILTYISCTQCAEDRNVFYISASVSAAMWLVMWVGNGELSHFISKKIPWVEFPVKRLVVGLVTTVAFTVLVAIGLLKVWEYSKDIRFSSYYDFIVSALVITFLISLFIHGREFLLQWRRSAVEAERYQKESIIAQYESLKNQVNPHFLFNSLNVLTNLVYEDQDKAALFIKKMSEVYRYVLDTRNKELVDLGEELAFTESYIYLQQIRFGDNLRVANHMDVKHGKVIPLAVQMLIENAIKHNEISSGNPLEITIEYLKPFIQVSNKVRLRNNPLEVNAGVGLENIRRRYEFLSQEKVKVINDREKFIVQIPLILNEHDS